MTFSNILSKILFLIYICKLQSVALIEFPVKSSVFDFISSRVISGEFAVTVFFYGSYVLVLLYFFTVLVITRYNPVPVFSHGFDFLRKILKLIG